MGAMVIHRTDGAAMAWQPLATAVRRELARQPVPTMPTDAPVVTSDVPASAAQCFELIETAVVRAAMARMMRQGRPSPNLARGQRRR